MKIGDTVQIKEGATKWMMDNEFWLDEEYPESIDGMAGEIVQDCTRFVGDAAHFALNITAVNCLIGVHPMWLIKIIAVNESEYELLKQNSALLEALQLCGVDQWEGYIKAKAMAVKP